jgi:hypothetical protein
VPLQPAQRSAISAIIAIAVVVAFPILAPLSLVWIELVLLWLGARNGASGLLGAQSVPTSKPSGTPIRRVADRETCAANEHDPVQQKY